MLERWLAISGREAETADAYDNLGLLYQTRGELEQAEEMHKKALAIEEKLSRQKGMANQYGNLGILYQTRGELDRLRDVHQDSLSAETNQLLLFGVGADGKVPKLSNGGREKSRSRDALSFGVKSN